MPWDSEGLHEVFLAPAAGVGVPAAAECMTKGGPQCQLALLRLLSAASSAAFLAPLGTWACVRQGPLASASPLGLEASASWQAGAIEYLRAVFSVRVQGVFLNVKPGQQD